MFWLWNNLLTFLKTFLVFADGLPSTAVLCHWQIAHAVPRCATLAPWRRRPWFLCAMLLRCWTKPARSPSELRPKTGVWKGETLEPLETSPHWMSMDYDSVWLSMTQYDSVWQYGGVSCWNLMPARWMKLRGLVRVHQTWTTWTQEMASFRETLCCLCLLRTGHPAGPVRQWTLARSTWHGPRLHPLPRWSVLRWGTRLTLGEKGDKWWPAFGPFGCVLRCDQNTTRRDDRMARILLHFS